MFRQNHKYKPKSQAVNFILMDGGVGDHVASLTAINYIVRKYENIKPLIWTPDFLTDFSRHLLPSTALVRDFSSMQKYYNPDLPTKTTKWDGIVSPMKTSCLEYAFMKLCDEKPSLEHMNYLKIKPNKIDTGLFNIPIQNNVVITTGYTAAVREFPAKEVNKIIDWCLANNLGVIFLGSTSTKTGTAHTIQGHFDTTINFDKGLNLINQTSLLQAARIMHEAVAVIGVDNGLLHVAGCTDTWIVGGFTTVNPEARMPIRNNILGYKYLTVTPEESLGCRFCQVKTNFIYDHNYINCLYDDRLCTTHMTADKFIKHLESIKDLK